MNKYDFKLTPAYCLYNGTAVLEQKGSEISFLIEKDDEIIKKRLRKAFCNYLKYVLKQSDCPSEYKNLPQIRFVKGNHQELRKCVSALYTAEDFSSGKEMKDNQKALDKKNEAAAVLLLDTVLSEARTKGATDIHIEKEKVKFRINGLLEDYICLKKERRNELVQRIKYLSGMNVMDKRRNQDGHFVYGNVDSLFVRVSTMGIIGNDGSTEEESVVIRLLDTKRVPLGLGSLGFNELQYSCLQKISFEKNGLVLICGPTGAGKSTTAASILVEIEKRRKGQVKIVSLEDPPEFVISGVTQIKIDETINNSYEEALVHVFRQDPDVLMIGEIRDEKSALVAIRAALTGHLVFATLHTSSTGEAVLRLENLKVERKLLPGVLRGIIVQEMNFNQNQRNLLADVSIPNGSFSEKIESAVTAVELDELFEHCTNYQEVLSKSLKVMVQNHKNKKKPLPDYSFTLKNKKLNTKEA